MNIVINDSKQTKRSFVVCFQFHTPTATFSDAERMDSVSLFFLHGICSMQGRLCAWKGLLPSKCQKTFMFPSILSQKYESISELHISTCFSESIYFSTRVVDGLGLDKVYHLNFVTTCS